jgi:transposase-like protein
LKKLNSAEKLLQKMAPANFRITYQFREHRFAPQHIQHATPTEPKKTTVDLFKIHKSDSLVGLILTFYVSFALSSRKTAYLIREVFNIPVSHQSVLNYAQAAAPYAHQFNLAHKGPIDDISVADETYIKISGHTNYVWFVLSAKKHTITAYHVADNRGTVSAVAALNEAIATADTDQEITVISDGHPAYVEAIHFINKDRKQQQKNKIKHIQVIGLKNQDEISEEYRPFKQIIERFNRTYKQHVRPSAGFKAFSGAMALTTLFVTHYNFLRPHTALGHKPPIHIEQLEDVKTIQGRWVRLLSMML